MEWKYKVGDLVRVRSSCKVGEHIGNIPFVGAMSAYKGRVFRIKSCEMFNEVPAYFLENVRLPQFYIDKGNFYFGDEMLEKIFYMPIDDLLDFLSDDN